MNLAHKSLQDMLAELDHKDRTEGRMVDRLYFRRILFPHLAWVGATVLAVSAAVYGGVQQYLRTAHDLELANSRIADLEKMPDKREVLDLRQKAEQLEGKVDSLTKAFSEEERKAMKYEYELVKEGTENRELKEEAKKKDSLYSTLQEEFNKLKETYNSLDQERNRLAEQGRTNDARYSRLEKEMNETKEKYQEAERQIKGLKEENEKTKSDYAKAEEEAKKLREDNSRPKGVDTFGEEPKHKSPPPKPAGESPSEKPEPAPPGGFDDKPQNRLDKPSEEPGLIERIDSSKPKPESSPRKKTSSAFAKPGEDSFSLTVPQAYALINGTANEDFSFGSLALFVDFIPEKEKFPMDYMRFSFGVNHDQGYVKQPGEDATFWRNQLRISLSGVLLNNEHEYLDIGTYFGWGIFNSHNLQIEPKGVSTLVLGGRARFALPSFGFEAQASASSGFNSGDWYDAAGVSKDYNLVYFDGSIKQYVGARTSLGLDGFIQYDVLKDLNRVRSRRATVFLETMGDQKAKDLLGYWLLLSIRDDDSKKLRTEVRTRLLLNPVGKFQVGVEGWYDDPHRGGSGWGVSAFVGFGISSVKDKPDLRIPLIYER